MKQTTIIGTDVMLNAGRSLFRQGEITHPQLEEMQRRNDCLNEEIRNNTLVLGVY